MKYRQCALKTHVCLLGRVRYFVYVHVHSIADPIRNRSFAMYRRCRRKITTYLAMKLSTKGLKSRMYIKWLVYPFVSILTHGSLQNVSLPDLQGSLINIFQNKLLNNNLSKHSIRD